MMPYPSRPGSRLGLKDCWKCRGLVLTLAIALCLALPPGAGAKIDLVTLSARDGVQTTIYNHADLTLVRDSRTLNLAKGMNQVQFSWANTRIDPTSLTLEVSTCRDLADVEEMTFPPGTRETGIWQIRAQKACQAKIDITYFTSGLSWQADYMAFLSRDGKTMDIKSYVTVKNQSGEDYPRASTRLVLGRINLLDEIAALANREYPFGRPQGLAPPAPMNQAYAKGMRLLEGGMAADALAAPKKILKQGVSEYFLYTIEGRETIEHGWSRQLLSFEARNVPVVNTYTHDPHRFGKAVIHRLTFENKNSGGSNNKHGLGHYPLPGGTIRAFRTIDSQGGLSFAGSDTAPYIPVGAKAALNLGKSLDVKIQPKLMGFRKENLRFDPKGNITGFDEVREMAIDIANFTDLAADLEIIRNQPVTGFILDQVQGPGRYEKTDQDTLSFYATLSPGQSATIRYRITLSRGDEK